MYMKKDQATNETRRETHDPLYQIIIICTQNKNKNKE